MVPDQMGRDHMGPGQMEPGPFLSSRAVPERPAPVVDTDFRDLPGSLDTKPRLKLYAVLAAFLLYLLLLLAIILLWLEEPPAPPPAPIPVKIVQQEPPKPQPPKSVPKPPAPETPPQPERPLTESGPEKKTTAPAPAKKAEEEKPRDAAPAEKEAPSEGKPAPAPLAETKNVEHSPFSAAKPAPPHPAKPEPPKPTSRPTLSKTPVHPEFRVTGPKEETGDPYMNELRDEIEKYRAYPPLARSLGLQGIATYRLVIDPLGRIMSVNLVESSGADILDRAGRDMILAPGKFPPPPVSREVGAVILLVRLPLYPD